jgi:triphosphoribosyl-dephospho-CoA synthase
MMDEPRAAISRRAFIAACRLDVAARKPGNVSFESSGHRMQAQQFLASAKACAQPLCRPGASVGERIEDAVRASWLAARCNTNLGIVLLCAPLAAAWEQRAEPGAAGLQRALAQTLRRLDLDDARAAYRAIVMARPGGLGSAAQQDVCAPPTVDLRAAMALAADRDRIAYQYAHDHAHVFELGLPTFQETLRRAREGGADAEAAARLALQRAYLEFVAAFPDSHIVRKHGIALAHSVMAEAQAWRARARRGELVEVDPDYADWDTSLKARGLNPGTSADLSVASAYAAFLCDAHALDAL